jgi:hypothetical protein
MCVAYKRYLLSIFHTMSAFSHGIRNLIQAHATRKHVVYVSSNDLQQASADQLTRESELHLSKDYRLHLATFSSFACTVLSPH